MDRIFFENIRCFATRQEVPLAPLTVLTGENSSGKTTVLALIRLAWDLAGAPKIPDFNEEPFLLGAHEQIVSRTGNVIKPEFQLGFIKPGEKGYSLFAKFGPRAGQPVLLERRL